MRGATYFLAAAVLVGLVTTSARATDPDSWRAGDDRVSVHAVGHPGRYSRHHSYYSPRHGGHGYSSGYHYGGRPYVVRPPIYPYPTYRPVYPGYHVCGPHCGPGCRYASPYNDFYYRGNGWGFSFGF